MIQEYVSGLDYDSRLFTTLVSCTRNADLILTIRVHLRRVDPPLQVGISNAENWGTPTDWENWCQSLKKSVEEEWNNKLWLVPSSGWGCDWPRSQPTHRPNVKCGLNLQLVTASQTPPPHLKIDCIKSSTKSTILPAGIGSLKKTDAEAREITYKGAVYKQVVAAHEFGHYLLGSGHVACETNDVICYGKTPHQRGDIMGMGHRIEPWHARPWLNRIKAHLLGKLNVVQWKAVTGGPRPAPIK